MNRGAVVEFGEAKQVLQNPQHDYTRLLLDSIPRLNRKWTEEIDWDAPIGAMSERMA
jgi:peptide/nickel transport system ATP-binding protein